MLVAQLAFLKELSFQQQKSILFNVYIQYFKSSQLSLYFIFRYPSEDHLTPVFIFERLCSIVYPEETETGEFYLSLEKDPQQEEFLQVELI